MPLISGEAVIDVAVDGCLVVLLAKPKEILCLSLLAGDRLTDLCPWNRLLGGSGTPRLKRKEKLSLLGNIDRPLAGVDAADVTWPTGRTFSGVNAT